VNKKTGFARGRGKREATASGTSYREIRHRENDMQEEHEGYLEIRKIVQQLDGIPFFYQLYHKRGEASLIIRLQGGGEGSGAILIHILLGKKRGKGVSD